eukprot:369933-Amphidinium_carterae.1
MASEALAAAVVSTPVNSRLEEADTLGKAVNFMTRWLTGGPRPLAYRLLLPFCLCSSIAVFPLVDSDLHFNIHLWEAWRRVARHPDDQVYQWFLNGAPCGIDHHPMAAQVFTQDEPHQVLDAALRDTDLDSFSNFTHTASLLCHLVDQKFLDAHSSIES